MHFAGKMVEQCSVMWLAGLNHDLPGRLAGAGGHASQGWVRGADLGGLPGLLHGQLHRLPVQAAHTSVDLVLKQYLLSIYIFIFKLFTQTSKDSRKGLTSVQGRMDVVEVEYQDIWAWDRASRAATLSSIISRLRI